MKISSWIKKVKHHLIKRLPKETNRDKIKNLSHIKKALLFRLKLLGYILLGFSLVFFMYSLTLPSGSEAFPTAPCEESSAHETLNFFVISIIFFCLGLFCLFTSWKNKKKTGK